MNEERIVDSDGKIELCFTKNVTEIGLHEAHTVRCLNCDLLEKISVIPGLDTLDLDSCPLLREIPVIPGLKKLLVNDCPLLREIPVIPGLKKLLANDCPLLEEIPVIPGLQVLRIECPLIREIPVIPELDLLIIGKCPLVREIPVLPNLTELRLYDCPLLEKIPFIPGLKTLEIFNCPLVKEIPVLPSLEQLAIYQCPLIQEIPPIDTISSLHIGRTNIKKIPLFPRLKRLTLPTLMPNIPATIVELRIVQSLTEKLPYIPTLHGFSCSDVLNPEDVVQSFPNLKWFSVRGISSMPIFPNLTTLYCSNTNIVEIPAMPCLKRITVLNAPFLTTVPTGVDVESKACPNLVLPYSG